jgi:1,4-dihydroxy-2-naphthoyl-CoA hydrolase
MYAHVARWESNGHSRRFTTIELKSNHLGTVREGTILGSAKPAHLGKTTQVWDAVITHKESGKTIALFRCTQLILYAK